MSRSRTCNNPAPAYDGKDCEGSSTESKTESCNKQQCPVDGGWTKFGNWVPTECSVSCGVGGERSLSRSRTCTSPMPNYGGKPCAGVSTESKKESCNSNPCPIDGGWTKFGNWVAAECSVSCGGGERSLSRSRKCTSPMPNYGGKPCVGVSTESKKESCNSNPCPIDGGWTEFEEWIPTTCSLSCGEGQRSLSRSRTCTNPPPQYDGKACEGFDSETNTETCNSNPCPIDGVWCDFNELAWTSCSAQCSKTGTQTRACDCPPAQHGGAPCDGSDTYTETMDCYEGACLVQTCDAAAKPSSSLPRNCGEYVRCDTNPEPLVMPCPAGLHFDDATGVCVAGDCGEIAEDEVDSPCNSDNNGAFVADDVDCTVFYQCSNGVAIPMSCPAGTMWDALLKTCVNGNCQVEVDDDVEDEKEDGAACANSDTGTLLPDPEDCHKYIMCANKKDESRSCGSLVFDPNISVCNWESVTNPCTTKP
ncbi:coadhesin-like isoform X2 [Mizuhopecten yessoensis]|uniref:coadhesin-like isoform X2 n=1 Tax=Mizuhopecten yessoensis TaxID=6573 RepID=UPI000B458A27|nr:coadhesin-like isoform X2 [Mizuhopecten yessoensis]